MSELLDIFELIEADSGYARDQLSIIPGFSRYIAAPSGSIYHLQGEKLKCIPKKFSPDCRVSLISDEQVRKSVSLSRILAETFHPTVDSGKLVVGFVNGDRSDYSRDNIYWMRRKNKSINHPLKKLSCEDVVSIFDDLISGVTTRDLAREYNVSHQTISNLSLGKTYSECIGFEKVAYYNCWVKVETRSDIVNFIFDRFGECKIASVNQAYLSANGIKSFVFLSDGGGVYWTEKAANASIQHHGLDNPFARVVRSKKGTIVKVQGFELRYSDIASNLDAWLMPMKKQEK